MCDGQGSRIRLDNLTVQYAGRAAPTLHRVTAELDGIVHVAGPSGAGKSTLLAALTGTLPHDAQVSGTISGTDAIGWAPQSPRAFATTARRELELYGGDADAALAELGLSTRRRGIGGRDEPRRTAQARSREGTRTS